MSISVIHVLCEGPTEERFVSKVLKPYLLPYNIVARPQIIYTSRKKDAKGGVVSYEKVKNDLNTLMKQFSDNSYEKHFFTTMIDLYALPNDFPGYNPKLNEPYFWVENIEKAFEQNIPSDRFIPYIQLHEFETLVLCNVKKLIALYPRAGKQLKAMDDNWRDEFNELVEYVNTSVNKAPSKRIISALNGKYKYNKVKSGTDVTADIGIDELCSTCPHFSIWIDQLKGVNRR